MTLFVFKAAEVRRLVDHCKAAPEHSEYYGIKVGPSIYLVGDHGVYLMSNGMPRDLLDPATAGEKNAKSFVVYADGINPEVDKGWYDAKRDLFGGDDGAEPIPLALFEYALKTAKIHIWVELTEDVIRVKS